ncbi:nitroreductase family protein [Wohlfahrtiimonas chitiniclastica]|uniref:Nitroreductase family protein n=1 Tax=Wohlfahrtiimonas chitiniclastica TaxID=400946 RepID=A0AB35BZ19_9GAMM|nr:nitroreductase family protein [Wohlfahrtiimonas chitiniclastica]MBS7824746.1 nitroreductase family protein [Wohlfahrtiimonas chitiniclastica]MBS7840420.1 nitroreductase family protein [Wohlfahrtiimonas chitiniclastica]
MRKLKDFIKSVPLLKRFISYLLEILNLFLGSLYDMRRFFKFGGWRKRSGNFDERQYYVMFLYHKLEKSLSYKKRNPMSGWSDVYELITQVEIAHDLGQAGYHDKAAKQVIEKFLQLPENINDPKSKMIIDRLHGIDFSSIDIHGSLRKSKRELQKGMLDNPEQFFFSRFSIREFSSDKVDSRLIHEGIELARKTPSVCNRQHWHVYHTADKHVRDIALKFQNGNRGFGHTIPHLLIITTDLSAFFTTKERNQGWIDGGMYVMSLIYAYHSLGLSCCALNWAQSPRYNQKLKSHLNISDKHSIICMLAVGYAQEDNLVCASARLSEDYFYSELKERI